MKTLVKVTTTGYLQNLFNSEQLRFKVSRGDFIILFYYFTTTRAEALIKRTTAFIYKKLTILNSPIIFCQLIMAWLG